MGDETPPGHWFSGRDRAAQARPGGRARARKQGSAHGELTAAEDSGVGSAAESGNE